MIVSAVLLTLHLASNCVASTLTIFAHSFVFATLLLLETTMTVYYVLSTTPQDNVRPFIHCKGCRMSYPSKKIIFFTSHDPFVVIPLIKICFPGNLTIGLIFVFTFSSSISSSSSFMFSSVYCLTVRCMSDVQFHFSHSGV